MRRWIVTLIAMAAVLVPAVGFAAPASASALQTECNSSASDNRVIVQQYDRIEYLDPGECAQFVKNSSLSVVVNGYSFRVRKDKNSGSYEACQNIPGSKRFTPSLKPNIIWYLNYDYSGCRH